MHDEDNLLPVPADRTSRTDDEHIARIVPLPPPEHLIRFFPIQGGPVEAHVAQTRRRVKQILRRKSDRLLVVVGPCSIHDPRSAMEYAQRLASERERLGKDLELVMRVYFEKPRTTVGWKGLINDPYLDGSFRINEGLRIARDLLVSINRLGVPAAVEFLDTISPQYLGDLVSWGAIGARTTESQVHRELASGISAPIGFKNGTDGDVRIAAAAILAARERHHFLSIHKNGMVAVVETKGNPDCHLILRGGREPNYHRKDVEWAAGVLAEMKVEQRLMIDCSHGNCGKDPRKQVEVATEVAKQVAAGDGRIVGAMLESHLVEGRQDLRAGKAQAGRTQASRALVYGQSITDGCLGWEATVKALDGLAAAVRARRETAK